MKGHLHFPLLKNLLAVTEVPVRPKKLPLKSQRGPTYNTYNKTMDPQGHSTLCTQNCRVLILLGIILQSTKEIYMYNLNFTKTVSLLNHIFPTTDVPKKYKGPPKFDEKKFLEVAISYTLSQNSYKNIGKVLCYNNSISWVNLINSCENNYSVVKLQS